MTIPPWLDVNPSSFLSAIQAGGSAGAQSGATAAGSIANANNLALKRAQMEQEAQMQASQQAAAASLQQGRFAQESAMAQPRIEQAAAELALREQSLQNAHAALQEKNAMMAEREARLASAADQLNQFRLGQLGQSKFMHFGGRLFKVNPQTGESELVEDAAPKEEKPKLVADLKDDASGLTRKIYEDDPSYQAWQGLSVEVPEITKKTHWFGRPDTFVTNTVPKPDLSTFLKSPERFGAGTATASGPAAAALASPKSSTGKNNEVVRVTKDGRSAIYNADTKEFLRYAE